MDIPAAPPAQQPLEHRPINKGHVDLSGARFGKVIAVKRASDYVSSRGSKYSRWECLCDCGKSFVTRADSLLRGKTRSCGCNSSRGKNATHRMTNTRLYRTWTDIKTRCLNPRSVPYKYYGGRGICVCDEWRMSFQSFHSWASSNGYTDELTIDRIDPNRGYAPDNCRWVSVSQQGENKRKTRLLTYNGTRMTLAQWARKVGMAQGTLRNRLENNWTVEAAITTPVKTDKYT